MGGGRGITPEYLELELAKAADLIVRDSLKLRRGESLLVTIDTETDFRSAAATACAAETVGAKVAVIWHTTPPGFGKAGDAYLPASLHAAIPNCDAWVEYNNQWLLYSTPWEKAMETKRVRYLCLGGIDVERMVRCIGKVDWPLTSRFLKKVASLTERARKMRISTPAGNDVTFEITGRKVVAETMDCSVFNPLGYHAHFLGGQVIWAPVEETINGQIVFDGALAGGGEAYFGTLNDPVELTIRKGKIVKVAGGREAKIFEKWLAKFNDANMYSLAHVCYGFNPGAKLTGVTVEDERVWGCTEWGIGYQSVYYNGKGKPVSASSHADGICLNSSVWLDGEQIMDEGKLVNEELAALAKKLGKQ
ncbi:MAG: aminopeptidase [Candidatus Bathyarchaeia archaeon]